MDLFKGDDCEGSYCWIVLVKAELEEAGEDLKYIIKILPCSW
jgi:hypothetical protein